MTCQETSNYLRKSDAMNLHLSLAPLLALVAGILILIMPRLLNFIVALYLIIIGLIGLLGGSHLLR
jgi:hypothetical protein